MKDFYSYYKQSAGKFSENAYHLFRLRRYKECVVTYSSFSEIIGHPCELGMLDALIWHHANHCLGNDVSEQLDFPRPPNASEAQSLLAYETSREQLLTSSTLNPIEDKRLLSQPSVISKSLLAAAIGIHHGCIDVIETGTYLGMSSYLFSGCFGRVHTIEADKLLYASSAKWLSRKASNIECYCGDSSNLIHDTIRNSSSKLLFFLDAHVTDLTTREFGLCPLARELNAIFEAVNDFVVVIDDIRLMGQDGYPDLQELISIVPRGKNLQIHHDQMIIF